MLLLFDIDHTLIDSGRAGLHALRRALADLHGIDQPESIELDLAGATDRSVFRDFAELQGAEPDEESWQRFVAAYLAELETSLSEFEGRVLPGVGEALEVSRQRGHHLGLLTGNLREGALAKLEHYGLAGHFDFDSSAFGCDHHDRNRFGPIAMERASRQGGRAFAPHQTVILGDTPRDIACAEACGAVPVGVASGKFSRAELDTEHTLDDLRGWPELLARLEAN